MLYDNRALAQFQVASVLNCSDADFCLQSGRTSKKGHSYINYDTSKKSGEVFVVGLQEVVSGNDEAQLDLLKEVVSDISDTLGKSRSSDNFFSSIKNLLLNCCNTHTHEKKFKKVLIDYRNTILTNIKSNWELPSETEKNKHLNVQMDIFVGYILLWL